MALLNITSPHAHGPMNTRKVMQWVLLACLPGIVVQTYWFGCGTLLNILWAGLVALASEALILKIRQRPIGFYLKDYSALVTAVLLGIALPPYAPWWLIAIGAFFAIAIVKQLYGGLGYNVFNPAMAAYVLLLISFPLQMSTWGAPLLGDAHSFVGITAAWQSNFTGSVDAVSSATPLDLVKQTATDQVYMGHFAGLASEWVNVAYLVGGLLLLKLRIYTWHAPLSLLATLALLSLLFPFESMGALQSVSFHLFTGASMFGAFFILTDPVTSATSKRGKIIFACGAGIILFAIRRWGNYPDAMAFAVLLMNLCAPLIDHFVQPRTYGHSKGQTNGGSQ